MKIALIIVHNKTDAENFNQIEVVKPFIDKIIDGSVPVLDENGVQVGTQDIYHYQIKGLNITHEAKFFQIIPFGVTPPSNLYDIDSHKVFYGAGDEDKTADHPRFFNWGLKRGTDYGADIVIYLDQVLQLTAAKARQALQKFVNDTEFVEATFGKLASLRLLKEVGQLKEDRNLTDAFTDLKTRVVQKGLKNG